MLETSGDEGVSIIKACMTEEDNECEAYWVDDVAANDKVKEVFVNNTTSRMTSMERFPPH